MPGILIVEDSPTQAEYLKALLMKDGRFEVTVSSNGASALEAVRQRKPSLIISDILMPEMDGFALCREIKAAEDLKDIPVILLTSLSSLQDILKGLECGADNFLRKPVDEKHLRSRIDHVLSNQELRSRERTRLGVTVYLPGQGHFISGH
jgi:DNA-binding response OmpR family regulator